MGDRTLVGLIFPSPLVGKTVYVKHGLSISMKKVSETLLETMQTRVLIVVQFFFFNFEEAVTSYKLKNYD